LEEGFFAKKTFIAFRSKNNVCEESLELSLEETIEDEDGHPAEGFSLAAGNQ